MAKAGENERLFKAYFEGKYGGKLKGKGVYKPEGSKVEISVDETLVLDGKHVLFEIDSGNTAKVIAGQYLLINELSGHTKDNAIFICIHFYKDYNPERTDNNLNLINENIYGGNAIPHKSFTFENFKSLCSHADTVKKLISILL